MRSNIEKLISLRISQARKAKNLTQEKFAELYDMSVSAISRIETGHNSTSIKTLCKLCNVLKVDLDYVLYDILPKENLPNNTIIKKTVTILKTFDDSHKYFLCFKILCKSICQIDCIINNSKIVLISSIYYFLSSN